jgi:aspartyl-tRNA(Asn)/glutamyl-tRNA(Gln) amidotransferase subunit A
VRTSLEIADAVRRGEQRATEVLEECLALVEARNGDLNAFVHLDVDQARAAAERVDAAVAAGRDPGPFAGVPFGVKDLEDCAGMPTSHGSLLFKDRGPVAEDSIHVARLRGAGAVPIGKTAAPEFGAVAFTSTRAWGTTRNPWNLTRTPGGSSGGSAAAVAAGVVPMCTASDGGGSTRIPASFCGLVGLKPTYGRIPHPGNQPSQTATFGILVTSVTEAARHLDVVAGPWGPDRTSLPAPTTRYEDVIESLPTRGLRVAWSNDLGYATVDAEVEGIAEAAAHRLVEAAGLSLVDHPVRLTDPVKVWLGMGVLDLFNNLEPGMFPERIDDFDWYNRGSIRRSAEVTAPRIARIWQRRGQLDAEFGQWWDGADVLLTPTTAVPAFAAEGPMPDTINGTTVFPGMSVPFTMVANLCWNPAISVPAGLTSEGLPVGLQIQAPRFRDDLVLRLARLFEQTSPWPRHAPPPDGAATRGPVRGNEQ